MAPPMSPRSLQEHGRFLRRVALALVGDPTLAEDVAQSTWVRALEKPPRNSSNLRAWLAKIARRLALQTMRAERRRRAHEGEALPLPDERSAGGQASRVELLKAVTEAVVGLPEPYRTTVLLRYYDGLSTEEIAERLGVARTTVRSRLTRAAEKLRTRLDHEFPGGRLQWSLAIGALAHPGGAPFSTIGSTAAAGSAASSTLVKAAAATTAASGVVAMSTASKTAVAVALAAAAGVGVLVVAAFGRAERRVSHLHDPHRPPGGNGSHR